jgi:hypothetical protein
MLVSGHKCSNTVQSLEASSLATDIISFSFLSSRNFVIATCTSEPDGCYQPKLDVYDFITARPEGSMEPRLVRIYQLPRVAQHTLTRKFMLGSEPSSELPTSRGNSFYPTSCSRLLTVSMHFTCQRDYLEKRRLHDYVLFVHASSLLEEVDAHSTVEHPTVRWKDWGPLKTRMVPICDYRPDFHVYGTRYIRQELGEVKPRGSRYHFRMFDFNPLALRRGGSQLVMF